MSEKEQEQQQQVFNILAQYTKDLSFENVMPASKISSDKQPEIDAQIKVEVSETNKEHGIYDVALIVNIQAKIENKTMFILDLNYSGEFSVSGFPKELMGAILYIECPRMLFPYARNIVSQAVNEGGFPPLYLAPVNFADLYQQQLDAKGQTLQ
ncbi:MAG: protein-export chaperone SecB [Alphaproteobacteria bacterium]|nr:protein-export chaperone SecB [Alphaproteobacteria bacterium]